jgi:hypothetical protein
MSGMAGWEDEKEKAESKPASGRAARLDNLGTEPELVHDLVFRIG